jgi:hypothetical protein
VPSQLWEEHLHTGRGRTAEEALHAEGVIPAAGK